MLRLVKQKITPLSLNCPKIYPEPSFKMQFDGCSKGNPGLAGAGYCIYKENIEISFGKAFVGEKATNNHSEYVGLIIGLQKAIELNISHLTVEGDSLLVINQMSGRYQCKSQNLINLYEEAKTLEKHFKKIYFNHILRNENKRADQLSNEAVKEYETSLKHIPSQYSNN